MKPHCYGVEVGHHYQQGNYAFENHSSGKSPISEFIASLSNFEGLEGKNSLAYFSFS